VLQISFAVEIFGFDVTNSLRNIAIDKNQVTREVLIVTDLDNAPDLDLIGFYWSKSVLASGNAAGIAGVLYDITVITTSVFKNVLDHRNADDKH